ncbi:MAG: nucleotidyltransferase domain-containing protein [Chitinophagales bacterium]|nr:nucleotidyltransferase domain-containing protein [Chitinophagales bacterium]
MKLAKKYVASVEASGIALHKAFLFGSYASNRQHEWSDIDIALIGDNFTGLTLLDKEAFRHLHILPEFMVVETHTFPTATLESPDPFLKNVIENGIEVPLSR